MENRIDKTIARIRKDHRTRMDAEEKWITVNGTHVKVDKEGELSGAVGKKISSTSKTTKKSSGPSKKGVSSAAKRITDIIKKIDDGSVPDMSGAEQIMDEVKNLPDGSVINLSLFGSDMEYTKGNGGWTTNGVDVDVDELFNDIYDGKNLKITQGKKSEKNGKNAYSPGLKGYNKLIEDTMSKKEPAERRAFLEANAHWLNGKPKESTDYIKNPDNMTKNQMLDAASDIAYKGQPGDVIEVKTKDRGGITSTSRYIRTDKYNWIDEGQLYNLMNNATAGRQNKSSQNEMFREIKYFIDNGEMRGMKFHRYS